MKTTFIDCGSNLGQGFTKISTILALNNNRVIMFEPNPHCCKKLAETFLECEIYQNAVWNKNEKRIFNIEYCPNEHGLFGGASNILLDKFKIPEYISDEYMQEWPPKNQEEVDCIDFSEFLIREVDLSDNIVLKLDIEGAEFEVLDKLIEEDLLKHINVIVVEWHPRMRKDKVRLVDYYLGIFESLNIQYIPWD